MLLLRDVRASLPLSFSEFLFFPSCVDLHRLQAAADSLDEALQRETLDSLIPRSSTEFRREDSVDIQSAFETIRARFKLVTALAGMPNLRFPSRERDSYSQSF